MHHHALAHTHTLAHIYTELMRAHTHVHTHLCIPLGTHASGNTLVHTHALEHTLEHTRTRASGAAGTACCRGARAQDGSPGHSAGGRTCLSQYAFISLLSGVCLLILNCTTEPSCPATLRLMWSFSVFTPSCKHTRDRVSAPAPARPPCLRAAGPAAWKALGAAHPSPAAPSPSHNRFVWTQDAPNIYTSRQNSRVMSSKDRICLMTLGKTHTPSLL